MLVEKLVTIFRGLVVVGKTFLLYNRNEKKVQLHNSIDFDLYMLSLKDLFVEETRYRYIIIG